MVASMSETISGRAAAIACETGSMRAAFPAALLCAIGCSSANDASAPARAATNAAPPLRPGLERRFFELGSYANPSFKIPIFVDVPPEWGTVRDRGVVALDVCSINAPLIGDVILGSRKCAANDARGCLDEIVDPIVSGAHDHHDVTRGDNRAVITRDVVKDGVRTVRWIEVKVADGGAVVCNWQLRGRHAAKAETFKAVCDSIVIEPRDAPPAESSPTPPRAGPTDDFATADDATARVATEFVLASSRGDVAAASKLLRGEESCASSSDPAGCRAAVAKDRSALSARAASIPRGFAPGIVELDEDFALPPPYVSLRVHSRNNPCSGGVDLVAFVKDGRASITFDAPRPATPP